jgi:hypothetical protein
VIPVEPHVEQLAEPQVKPPAHLQVERLVVAVEQLVLPVEQHVEQLAEL